MKANEIIRFENAISPAPIKVKDKTENEKVPLISRLVKEDNHTVYSIIDGMLTKQKIKNFFEQNIQTA